MDVHNAAVQKIADQIQTFSKIQQPFRIYHGSTNSTRKSPYQRSQMVDTSTLNHVLSVDTTTLTALCEPNVSMDALVAAVLPFGMVPPVVMEFPGITVGGGFAGTGGESSSFKYGFFDRTVNWIEIVTADGRIVKATKSENSDLFFGAASSFGTLGVTTLLEVQLIPAKKYVEMTYIPVDGMESAVSEIKKFTREKDVDYVDGIMFAKDRGVICVGRLKDVAEKGTRVTTFTARSDPWFYIHVDRLWRFSTSKRPVVEAIPLKDYLFRYDRGGFWVAKYAYHYFLTPFNRFTRYILDYYMHTRVMYHALHQSGLSTKYIIQDVAIPLPQTTHFLAYLDIQFTHYPIWLCPITQTGLNGTHTLRLQSPPASSDLASSSSSEKVNNQEDKVDNEEMMLNFGVWGPGPNDRSEFISWNRSFERKVHELRGQKWLYAHTYYTQDEFDQIYQTRPYHALRKKWKAEYLPTVYDKVKVDFEREERERKEEMTRGWIAMFLVIFWTTWPFQGLWGVWKAFRGGDYLLPPKVVRREGRREGKKEV